MEKLSGKVILITGSSQGIGKFLAKKLAERGAHVIINGRGKEKLIQTKLYLAALGLKAHAIQGDVSNLKDCKNLVAQTVDRFGKIDMLINMAGVNMWSTIEESDALTNKKLMDINFFGSLWCTQAALPYIKVAKGNIIFISSIASFHGIPYHGVYSSSKRALTSLAEALKIELYDTGIHIGIAYLGLTEVEPAKKVYDKDGLLISRPENGLKEGSIERATDQIIKMINKRTFKSVFSLLGKMNSIANRISPALVQWILLRNYIKTNG